MIQISIREMNFKFIYFPNYEKLKCFVVTFTSYNQILIFEEQLCMSYKIFIFDTDQAKAEEHFLQNLNFKVRNIKFSVFYYFISNILVFFTDNKSLQSIII